MSHLYREETPSKKFAKVDYLSCSYFPKIRRRSLAKRIVAIFTPRKLKMSTKKFQELKTVLGENILADPPRLLHFTTLDTPSSVKFWLHASGNLAQEYVNYLRKNKNFNVATRWIVMLTMGTTRGEGVGEGGRPLFWGVLGIFWMSNVRFNVLSCPEVTSTLSATFDVGCCDYKLNT